jgi:hypothetical protein
MFFKDRIGNRVKFIDATSVGSDSGSYSISQGSTIYSARNFPASIAAFEAMIICSSAINC